MYISIILAATVAATAIPSHPSTVKPFKVDLSKDVPRMQQLIRNTRLPTEEEYPGLDSTAGIDLNTLKGLQRQWLTDFNWEREQKEMNRFKHFTTEIEGLTTHFVHEKSTQPGAIPIILGHGWPSTFLEYAPLIKNLTQPFKTSSGKTVSFDVIVPSLPGFAFSEKPPAKWTIDDTGRLWNTLMTRVLGYKQYAVHGTDYGSGPTYSMYDQYNTSVRAAHFVFIPFFPELNETALNQQNINLSPLEQDELKNAINWYQTGTGYFVEQNTKPNTIGLALQDNPIGQLSWIAEKYIAWSDPRQGTGPSVLTHSAILRTVSLFYLSQSFLSSCFIYFQNAATGFKLNYVKARTDAPMLFSAFKYNVGFWPPAKVAQVGNLVSYRNHDFGGHFPGLDNPAQLLEDPREIGEFWH